MKSQRWTKVIIISKTLSHLSGLNFMCICSTRPPYDVRYVQSSLEIRMAPVKGNRPN